MKVIRKGFWKGTHKPSFFTGVMAAGLFLWSIQFMAYVVKEVWGR